MADMHTQSGGPAPNGRGPGHELSDVSIGGLVTFGVCLVAMIVGTLAILGVVMSFYGKAEKRAQAKRPALFRDEGGQFPEPRLLEEPRPVLAKYREEERRKTQTYGWIDKEAGIARIPVDRAIDILAEKDLPKGRSTPPRGSRTRDQR